MAKTATTKPAARARKKAPAKPGRAAPKSRRAPQKARAPRKPVGGILGDIIGLRAGLRASFEALLERQPGEERMFAYLAIASLAGFLVGLPTTFEIAAGMEDKDAIIGLVAGRFVAFMMFGTLFLYGVAALSHGVAKWGFGGRGTHPSARLALFWAVFLSIPLGLVQMLLGQVFPVLGLEWLIGPIGVGLFLFWVWIWTSFLAIAEGFSRGAVFLLALSVLACLTGLSWLLSAIA